MNLFNNKKYDLTLMNQDEKCEIVVVNPCFGVRYYPADLISLSSFACDSNENINDDNITVYSFDAISKSLTELPKSNFKKVDHNEGHKSHQFMSHNEGQAKKDQQLTKQSSYPLHEQCASGNLKQARVLIDEKHFDPMQLDSNNWYPIHHAAFNGHYDCVKMLLKDYACSPNVTTSLSMTALHLAAMQGHNNVVKVLLEHPDIDIILKNSDGKTCLDMCVQNPKKEWQVCADLIKNMFNKSWHQVTVHLMDGSILNLDLISGANTTVQQLQKQMIKHLDLPVEHSTVFSFWICSKNLKLQLKNDHKPMEHLVDWKRRIIPQFTDVDPLKEEASLFFMRDARLTLKEEKKIRHPWVIRLLCFEAYHNYINSLYPCSEDDTVKLSSIFMEIINEDYDLKQWKTYLSDEKNLQLFVPVDKLKRKASSFWLKAILKEYESKLSTYKALDDLRLQYKFLSHCWNLTVYGSSYFHGAFAINKTKMQSIYVCINDVGIHIINKATRALEFSYSYNEIIWKTYGSPSGFEIKHKSSSQILFLHTKQYSLIDHLMKKLKSQANDTNSND